MASSPEYVEFVCDSVRDCGVVRAQKMFGDYLVYVDEKPLLLLCDNTTYVKHLPALAGWLKHAETGVPYPGAKDHYILDVEDRELCRNVIAVLKGLIPLPRKKSSRVKRTQKVEQNGASHD